MLAQTTAILLKVCRAYTKQTDELDPCANPFVDLDVDLPFSQPVTFAHLEWQRCLAASHDKVRRSFTCAKNQPQRLAPNLAKSPWTLQY